MISFTIPGEARGKGRPRATTIHGHARMYTDAKTASYENLVRLACREAMGDHKPISVPVCLYVAIYTRIPKVSARKRGSMLAGETLPGKRPDLSNVLKAVEDGMNGVAFVDDALVVTLTAMKRYSDQPRVDVWVAPA